MSRGAPRSTGRADVLIAGGGTAGHVLPAIAVAEALVKRGHPRSAIRFVGSRRGMEATFVPRAGFPVTLLPGRGIVRRFSLQNVRAVAGLGAAVILSVRLLVATRPRAIVALGGYASVPPALAGMIARVPIVVVNLDAVAGAANRLVGRFAVCCAVSFPNTALPRALLTGAPLREAVVELDTSEQARRGHRVALEIGDRDLVVVIGGSLGARRLNDAALGLADRFRSRADVVLYHVTGERDHARVVEASAAVLDEASLDYRPVAFEDHLAEVLLAADLVVSRSGASTVAELAVLRAASILVPLPNSPRDHQRRNAEVLANAGGAIIVDDGDATASNLEPLIRELLADAPRRDAMRAGAGAIAIRDGSRSIAALVEEVARAKQRVEVPCDKNRRTR